MHLSPESLEAFVQAVSLGSFSAAARKLGKSQSTVSEAIARLEIDLGLELFDRSGRQPQLTEAGRTLLGRVEEVLGASDRLRRVAALLAGGSEPRVTLALSTPTIRRATRRAWPNWTSVTLSWSSNA